MATIYGECPSRKDNVVCTGMVGFGATAVDVHHCDVEAYGDEGGERFVISIYPHDRERDVPVSLRLKLDEACQLLGKLRELIDQHQEPDAD
jgi:hypothetical protein